MTLPKTTVTTNLEPLTETPKTHGGARNGSGRKPRPCACLGCTTPEASAKVAEARDVVSAAAAIYELVGQSSVALDLDSKGAIKPSVKVYHRDAHEAARLAQELFDEQLLKYVFSKPTTEKAT